MTSLVSNNWAQASKTYLQVMKGTNDKDDVVDLVFYFPFNII